jgi:uncharacterized protein
LNSYPGIDRLVSRRVISHKRSAWRDALPRVPLFLIVALTIWHSSSVFAAEVIPPKPDRYFNDYAHVVSSETAHNLNEQLAQFERDTSNQFVVAIWKTMPSASSIEDFTQRTFQSWKGWQEGKNNGVVLFVFVDDHRMRIQPGYGLEGALPDATCDQIIRNEIAPSFRRGDYENGLRAGINAVVAATKGEYTGTGRTVREGRRQNSPAPIFIFLIFFVIMLIRIIWAQRHGYRYSGSGGPFIGGWGGGSGGGWSSGGGGGFSGFSGGGFTGGSGGGGASGSW